jgi:drug/metabolite transporter (DMT)-like permease
LSAQVIPYILVQGFLFGSTLIASRFSVGQFSPTTYIGLRMLLASLGHVAFYMLGYRGRTWPTNLRLWRHAAMLGVFGTAVPMTSIVSSLQYQSAGVTSVLLTAGPAITVLLAHFFLIDESLTRLKSLGVVLALAGALLLALRGESGLPDVDQASPLGYGLVLLAMICASSMAVYARRFMQDLDAFDVASIRMFTATLAVMPLSALLVGINLEKVNGQGYFALGYAALVGTFGGMMLAFYIIKRFSATAQAMSLYVIPVIAGLGGALLLNEQITVGMLAGMALIVLGITLINQR